MPLLGGMGRLFFMKAQISIRLFPSLDVKDIGIFLLVAPIDGHTLSPSIVGFLIGH